MRLLARTNRIHLLFTAGLLLVTGCVLYVIITSIISDEVTEKLRVDQQRIALRIAEGQSITNLPPIMEVVRLSDRIRTGGPLVHDTAMWDPVEEDTELFREVREEPMIDGIPYRITVRAIVLEPHDYYLSIGLSMLVASVLLLAGLWFVNARISRTVWGPFRADLESLKRFDLRTDASLDLKPSDIQEFAELNDAVMKLTERIRTDHRALKEFTGNASHEMQTPLAIVQAKLEETLGRPGLDEGTVAPIKSAYDHVLRLSRLHQGLLLLSRIENGQFATDQRVDIAAAVESQLSLLGDRIMAKGITVEKDIDIAASVRSHPVLIETLLANLIGNAIKHNRRNGTLIITVRNASITLTNTGDPLSVPPEELFQRFRKADPTSASPGLGLSIAKSICDTSGWRIAYSEADAIHTLHIDL